MAGWGVDAHRALKANDVRQAAYVPDSGLTELLGLCEGDAEIRDILLSHEQEGAGVIAGAWLGGERACLLIQSSGVGNTIASLSLTKACRFPFLALVTMRGEWREFNPWQLPMGQSAADHLKDAGVTVWRVDDVADTFETVGAAATLAFETQSAHAVLIAQRVIGAKNFNE